MRGKSNNLQPVLNNLHTKNNRLTSPPDQKVCTERLTQNTKLLQILHNVRPTHIQVKISWSNTLFHKKLTTDSRKLITDIRKLMTDIRKLMTDSRKQS